METILVNKLNSRPLVLAATVAVTALCSTQQLAAAPNNAPSFTPGDNPYSSPCDGEVRLSGWAQNVTDNDGETSRMKFKLIEVSNSDIFAKLPHLSWPSYTLSYRLKPGTAGGLVSEITGVLIDDAGTQEGGSDTSEPGTWSIFTESCRDADLDGVEDPLDTDLDGTADEADLDDDNDGISDADEGGGLLDSDGDGVANSLDLDSDDDLIPDENESGDADGDGIRDSEEAAGDDVKTDSDSDGIDDGLDLDDDNDGIIDTLEGPGDTDNDGIPDSLDNDSDNDGRSDLLESGLDVSLLIFSQDWAIENPVGGNGLADLVETFADSGFPINTPVDSNGDGIADFQDPLSPLFSADDSSAADDGDQRVTTGLNGIGCALGTGASGSDPVLLLIALFALTGLMRRRRI